MNSFAHYSFGAVYQWMVENIGGIRSDGPSYKHLVIAPHLDDKLTRAAVGYDSIRGRNATTWKRDGDKFNLDITIPANITATVFLPGQSGRGLRYDHRKRPSTRISEGRKTAPSGK